MFHLILLLVAHPVVFGPVRGQLPGFMLISFWELLMLFLFIVVWCPLDGGGGGGWWWVLFGIGAAAYTVRTATPSHTFSGVISYVFSVAEALLLSLASGKPDDAVPVTPFWDPCAEAKCCVVKKPVALYNPWSANVTVPFWWASSGLKWHESVDLALLALLLVLVAVPCIFLVLQVMWLCACCGRGRLHPYSQSDAFRLSRPLSMRSRRGRSAKARGSGDEMPERLMENMLDTDDLPDGDPRAGLGLGGAASASHIPLGQLYADITLAREHVTSHFGGSIFQPAVIDASVEQLKGFVTSRARRQQGYALHRETLATHEEQSLLSSAINHLEPPTGMPIQDAAAVWGRLTDNLRAWVVEADFRSIAPRRRFFGGAPPHAFGPIQSLLAQHAASAGVKIAQLHHQVPRTGPTVEHWEVLLLLLAVGGDNFYRSAPECVNLLFMSFYCEYKLADPKAKPGRRAAPTSDGGVGDRDEASDGALYQHDLHDLRVGLYELLRYAGGKVGNRAYVDGVNLMRDDFMNFDDLSELCGRRYVGRAMPPHAAPSIARAMMRLHLCTHSYSYSFARLTACRVCALCVTVCALCGGDQQARGHTLLRSRPPGRLHSHGERGAPQRRDPADRGAARRALAVTKVHGHPGRGDPAVRPHAPARRGPRQGADDDLTGASPRSLDPPPRPSAPSHAPRHG